MPIGKSVETWTADNQLKFRPKFTPSEVNPFGQQVYNAYKQGFLTSFSVRFDPIEWEDIPKTSDDSSNQRFRQGRKYKSLELLEISAVNIPANPEATKNIGMYDFIVKSYLYENKSNINLDLRDIYQKSDDKLKEKIDKLLNLKEVQQKNLDINKIQEIELFVDSEIARLEKEIAEYSYKNKLDKELKELRDGITVLLK
jgi:uncharacterized protein YlaN (UPF0358 family)